MSSLLAIYAAANAKSLADGFSSAADICLMSGGFKDSGRPVTEVSVSRYIGLHTGRSLV